nr:Protein ZK1236.9 [Haemonchus contortus]
MPSSSTQEPHRPIYDMFTVAGGRTGSKGTDPFLIRSHSNPNQHSPHVAWSASVDDLHSAHAHASFSTLTSSPKSSHLTSSFDSALPSSTTPNDVIVSLPNSVVESARRASSHDGGNYLRLAKAPGDVSMSPQQLILCLSAASKKLSTNIYRGVQLRISELKEAIDKGRISERCLKSLNYVVDSIDRGCYDDAQTFYDRLRAEFPEEMGPWAQQGVNNVIRLVSKEFTTLIMASYLKPIHKPNLT